MKLTAPMRLVFSSPFKSSFIADTSLRMERSVNWRGYYSRWRRGWDSNPRRATNPCWFSRPVHSTALPPLHNVLKSSVAVPTAAQLLVFKTSALTRCILAPRPAGALRASKIVPDDFVNRSATSPGACYTGCSTAHFARRLPRIQQCYADYCWFRAFFQP